MKIHMRNPTYILLLCLCCFTVLGQQKADRPATKANPAPSKEMLAKYKQHDGWVKLTAEIDRQDEIAAKLRSQIKAQDDVIRAKAHANKDTSSDRARLNQLHKSYEPLASKISKMVSERNVIESEIRMRETNKK